MNLKRTKGLRARLRAKVSSLGKRIRQEKSQTSSSEQIDSPTDQTDSNPPLFKQTTFRSELQLGGSSKVYIWFETLQETGIRFCLDLSTGALSDVENWNPEVNMPGENPIDPEPLSVWGIDSMDDQINITMHVDCFDELFIDRIPTPVDEHPEVRQLLKELTNVAVRNIWIEALPSQTLQS